MTIYFVNDDNGDDSDDDDDNDDPDDDDDEGLHWDADEDWGLVIHESFANKLCSNHLSTGSDLRRMIC